MELAARVLTVSDSVAAGTATDRSGPALVTQLRGAGWRCEEPTVVRDGVEVVAEALRSLTDSFAGLVVTTGGTGFAPGDQTPEATRSVLERDAPGLAELSRSTNRLGALGRGVAGVRGSSLILNLPGSVAGANESLEAVLDLLPHAVSLLVGTDPHPHGRRH